MTVDRPGQQVLKRSSIVISGPSNAEDGEGDDGGIELRFCVSLPAQGTLDVIAMLQIWRRCHDVLTHLQADRYQVNMHTGYSPRSFQHSPRTCCLSPTTTTVSNSSSILLRIRMSCDGRSRPQVRSSGCTLDHCSLADVASPRPGCVRTKRRNSSPCERCIRQTDVVFKDGSIPVSSQSRENVRTSAQGCSHGHGHSSRHHHDCRRRLSCMSLL